MKNTLYIIVLLLVFTSCKKEHIPELTGGGEVVKNDLFYLNGQLGTDSIKLKATENYYMFSSYFFDQTNEIFVFEGELKETNCTNCGIGIKIKLNNYKTSPSQIINFNNDSIFENGILKWNDPLFLSDFLEKVELIIDYNNGDPVRSSYSISQPSNTFEILDFEYFGNNELGQSTVRLSFVGRVLVPTSTPASKVFTFEGKFAFAFPS